MLASELGIPAALRTSCVILDKSPYPSGPPLSRLKIGDYSVCFITEVW